MSFQRILIAVDDSACAERAADVGIELAKSLKSRVGFVHVFDRSVGPGSMWGVPASTLSAVSEQVAKDLLARFLMRAAKRSDVAELLTSGKPASEIGEAAMRSGVAEFLTSGKPAGDIVHVAKKWPADMIVMGSHGRGKIQSLLIGSVAQEVLRGAPCPVLLVRAQI